jgi:hypothetical protein
MRFASAKTVRRRNPGGQDIARLMMVRPRVKRQRRLASEKAKALPRVRSEDGSLAEANRGNDPISPKRKETARTVGEGAMHA